MTQHTYQKGLKVSSSEDRRHRRSGRGTSRRDFLRGVAATGAVASLGRLGFAASSANEQLNLGLIGCGWRGGQLLNGFGRLKGVRIAGLCDPDAERLAETAKDYSDATTYRDLRELLDSRDIDAVLIATCNHWHCLAAIWALQAEKHVYVEKPLAHTHWEGTQLVRAAARHARVCQVGLQHRSDPMQEPIKQFLHGERALGQIRWVRVNRYGLRGSIGKRPSPLQVPANVDYDLWLGPARHEPLYREKLHYDWHWDWNTGSGELGNWGVHVIDDVRNVVFRDEVALPERVAAAGGRFAWNDAGETPNVHFAILDTGAIPVVIGVSNIPARPGEKEPAKRPGPATGYVVYCEGGRLEGRRGEAVAFDALGKKVREFSGGDGGRHARNFVEACRTGEASRLHAPVEVGHYSTAWCNVANIATRIATDPSGGASQPLDGEAGGAAMEALEQMQRVVAAHDGAERAKALQLGPMLKIDPRAERFIGDRADDANELLRRRDREPFAVPEIAVG